mmetsp:Transcript_9992/g.22269  ORF Transcript_9992/g.22269 Transcript_9992/m.22269 type:complete len:209 (+) Transcript_9992:416-1042(+)
MSVQTSAVFDDCQISSFVDEGPESSRARPGFHDGYPFVRIRIGSAVKVKRIESNALSRPIRSLHALKFDHPVVGTVGIFAIIHHRVGKPNSIDHRQFPGPDGDARDVRQIEPQVVVVNVSVAFDRKIVANFPFDQRDYFLGRLTFANARLGGIFHSQLVPETFHFAFIERFFDGVGLQLFRLRTFCRYCRVCERMSSQKSKGRGKCIQ